MRQRRSSRDGNGVHLSVGQDFIYYLCGQSITELQKSPHLEKLLEKDYEVIYFVEPMDEYMMQGLIDFDDKRFMDASKEDLKLEKDDTVSSTLISHTNVNEHLWCRRRSR